MRTAYEIQKIISQEDKALFYQENMVFKVLSKTDYRLSLFDSLHTDPPKLTISDLFIVAAVADLRVSRCRDINALLWFRKRKEPDKQIPKLKEDVLKDRLDVLYKCGAVIKILVYKDVPNIHERISLGTVHPVYVLYRASEFSVKVVKRMLELNDLWYTSEFFYDSSKELLRCATMARCLTFFLPKIDKTRFNFRFSSQTKTNGQIYCEFSSLVKDVKNKVMIEPLIMSPDSRYQNETDNAVSIKRRMELVNAYLNERDERSNVLAIFVLLDGNELEEAYKAMHKYIEVPNWKKVYFTSVHALEQCGTDDLMNAFIHFVAGPDQAVKGSNVADMPNIIP